MRPVAPSCKTETHENCKCTSPNSHHRYTPKDLSALSVTLSHLMMNYPSPFNAFHYFPVIINFSSSTLWSKPIPLGWYFGPQWERIHGRNWPRALCDNWLRTDRFLRNFAANIPVCPCTLEHATLDKGRFMPDFECDRD